MIDGRRWWEVRPGVRDAELAALSAAQIEYKVDEDALQRGVFVLHLQFPRNGALIELVAVYPHEYPYFHPDVYAPSASFERHQDVFAKRLCLIGPRTQEWKPEWTLAEYLKCRMEMLLQDLETPTPPDEDQAAPISGYFEYHDPSFILVDGNWRTEGMSGHLLVSAALITGSDGLLHVQGLVGEVRAAGGARLAWPLNRPGRFDINMIAPFSHVGKLQPVADSREHLAALAALRPQLLAPAQWVKHEGGEVALSAVCFNEEVSWGKDGIGWQFFLLHRKSPKSPSTIYRVRSHRAGPGDLGARVPAVRVLRDKKILLLGCGAVGAPIAAELARCGTKELRLLDNDSVEPGPTIRWPLGIAHCGQSKAQQLSLFLGANYLHSTVRFFHMRIGECPRWPMQLEILRRRAKDYKDAFDGVDLVIDATAEVGVQQFVSEWCYREGIPHIYAAATPGAVGGMIGRFVPGSHQGCWFCLQRAIYTEKSVPEPPRDDGGQVLPAGCCHPTFTGASFDLAEVSLQATRMAVQTLSGGADSAFAHLSFAGPLALPQWASAAIPRYPDCPVCSR